jgi:hypothetical protein
MYSNSAGVINTVLYAVIGMIILKGFCKKCGVIVWTAFITNRLMFSTNAEVKRSKLAHGVDAFLTYLGF